MSSLSSLQLIVLQALIPLPLKQQPLAPRNEPPVYTIQHPLGPNLLAQTPARLA